MDDQYELGKKREEMAKMIIESQAASKEILALYDEQDSQKEAFSKLEVEITVIVTEKLTLKKEYDRLENEHRKIKKDFKEQRVNMDLLMDEVAKANKMNREYRGHILESDIKQDKLGNEISEL